jgi:hypothetical protein
MRSEITLSCVEPAAPEEAVPARKGIDTVPDCYVLGFRDLSDFEPQLSRLASEGMKPYNFLNFFGKRYEGSPFIKAAERLFDLGTGDFSFDSAPLVLASEYGAYRLHCLRHY